jgi:hypothetical protein
MPPDTQVLAPALDARDVGTVVGDRVGDDTTAGEEVENVNVDPLLIREVEVVAGEVSEPLTTTVLLTAVVEVEPCPLVDDAGAEELGAGVGCHNEEAPDDVAGGDDVSAGDDAVAGDDVVRGSDVVGGDDVLGCGNELSCSVPLTDAVLEVGNGGMLIDGIVGNVTTGDVLVDGKGGGAALGLVLLVAILMLNGLFVEVGVCSAVEMGCSDVCVLPGTCELVKTGGCVLNSGGALLVTTGWAAKALQ